jgi:glycosyl transferase family 25
MNIDHNPTVTYVTAFIDLNEDITKNRPIDVCIEMFKNIAKSGVAICLYLSSKYENIGKELENDYKNIKLMPITNLDETKTYKIITELNPNLPAIRTECHDTINFLILMNAKSEFVYNASLENPFNTEHFAWIDFSIYHIANNIEYFTSQLRLFGYSKLKDNFLLFPCCWSPKQSKDLSHNISININWRFCGGFFIGDKTSIKNMHELMLDKLPYFIKHTGNNIIAWEVNVWAWLEMNYNWKIDYYNANHNDSIIDIPKSYISIVASLTSIPSRFDKCKLVIDSLINQVEHIYLNLCSEYKRFSGTFTNDNIPLYFSKEEPYKSKLTITFGKDYGPATKYLGSLEYISKLSELSKSQWIFFCDDDQEYHPNLINKMLNNVSKIGVYQNRYNIVKTGSGGIIHGYVGNLMHISLLNELPNFDLPDIAKYVDDQWMSIYCKMQKINIYPSGIELYSDIFSILENGYEKIGTDSLAGLYNRDTKIKELESHYNVKFIQNGDIVIYDNINLSSNSSSKSSSNFNINKYIDKVIYINLEYRIDRKQEIENELNNYNIPYERFNGFSTPDFGILGCTKSHLEVLKIAKAKKYKNILILEDDFKFIVSRNEFEKNIELLFETQEHNFDVCMLSYNLIKSDSKSDSKNELSFLIKVLEVQTASGYIVNESIYDRLIELYEYALPLLESTRKHWIYANDQIWKTLQPNSNWYCFTQRIGIQRPSYSDNGKSFCDLGC